jgi:alpha-ribazole phosphatase/probable phosphoglycerate mutase
MLAAEPISRIYCSTAVRARETAELLADGLRAVSPGSPAVPVVAMPGLVEAEVSAEVLRAWVVEGNLARRAADGETGDKVVSRMEAVVREIADAGAGRTVAVVGHVASLTLGLGRLCGLGTVVWGTPLPNALPFLVEWDGRGWRCPAWPVAGAEVSGRSG